MRRSDMILDPRRRTVVDECSPAMLERWRQNWSRICDCGKPLEMEEDVLQGRCVACRMGEPEPPGVYQGTLADELAELVHRPRAAWIQKKNDSYGDAVFLPCPVSGLDPETAVKVRIGDKVRRLVSGGEFPGDDTLLDLAGYLDLLALMKARREG